MAQRQTRLSSRAPLAALAVLVPLAGLGGCAIGPDYKRPSVPMSASFKEAAGWKLAQPSDALDKGKWWTVFNDPVLNSLEEKVLVSNQNLVAAEAAFRQAKALVEETQATIFPNVTGTASDTRAQSAGANSVPPTNGVGRTSTTYALRAAVSWDVDVWGRIRRSIEAARDTADASQADLANATLSAQIALANDYVQLREQDESKRLLDLTIAGYAKSAQIAQNKYAAGVSAQSDVLTAETQLQSAQAQAVDLARTRAALEHAIAVLIGEAPADLTIAPSQWSFVVPQIPVSAPSALLERRPDVAAAERSMAAANAQIGVNMAGFFPDLSIPISGGYSSSTLSKLVTASASSWSIGPTITQTIFDAGATQGRVRAAQAAYQAQVADYREAVLTALQQVEDELVAERVLAEEAVAEASAVKAARQAEATIHTQYVAGTQAYTAVIVAETTALADEESAVTIRQSRLVASIALIEALGGGWDASQLPSRDQIESDQPLNFNPLPPTFPNEGAGITPPLPKQPSAK